MRFNAVDRKMNRSVHLYPLIPGYQVNSKALESGDLTLVRECEVAHLFGSNVPAPMRLVCTDLILSRTKCIL